VTGGVPARLTKGIAAAATSVNPQLALTFRPLAGQVRDSLTLDRLMAQLAGFFGALALLLAGLGLYGVTAYGLSRRRTEIGIRLALGADPARVTRFVLSRVALLVVAGVATGVALSLWASKFVAGLLYGLEPQDPATLAGTAAVLLITGIAAAWFPVRRATRMDPGAVLREG
jgi:ABC-type antimicrobial peptide transport system permease subunit